MFGAASGHYDTTPSPNSLAGGGAVNLFGQGGVAAGAADIFGDITSGQAFSSPSSFLGTVLKTTSVLGNAKALSKEGLKQEGFGILKDQIGAAAGIDVSGVANTAFPKTASLSGFNDITKAVAGVAGASAVVKAVSGDKPLGSISTFLASNPGALDNLTKATVFKKQHLNDKGEATPNAITTAWNNISSSAKTAYNNITKNNLQTHSKSGNVDWT